jgi:predicted trehalose synthase
MVRPMVCATCDFLAPCACERKRLASSGAPASPRVVTADRGEIERLKDRLHDAANMIAALLLEKGADVSPSVAAEAETLLEALRTERI